MLLVELPFAFASLVFVVGSFVFGFIYILIIKYTFIEGIFFQCSEIQFFCS